MSRTVSAWCRSFQVGVFGLVVIATVIASACSGSAVPTAPTDKPSNGIPIEPATSSIGEPISTNAVSTQATTPPQIIAIGGVSNWDAGITNGLVSMDCGKAYNGYRVVNDRTGAYTWTITGSNFGGGKGTVTLNGQSMNINSWTTGSITIDPTMPWSSGPVSTILKVRTSSGPETNQGVQIVPAIATRIFGQCTYFVAFRRKQIGLEPSPTAYGGYSSITGSYVPKRGDQFQWPWSGGKHTGIARTVTGPVVVSGSNQYTVTIEEQNLDCKNGQSQFVATFAVKKGSIVTPLKHPKLGNTTLYYR